MLRKFSYTISSSLRKICKSVLIVDNLVQCARVQDCLCQCLFICGTSTLRDVWCSRRQVLNLCKFVTAWEPGVSEDLLETALGAKPLTRVFLEELLNQVLELW